MSKKKVTTYIIMADGKGTRWNHYQGIEKHLIEIDGETIIERTIRLVSQFDPNAEIIVTSHDPSYTFAGSTRYEPLNNQLEIDRFTVELIDTGVCFLYGDTYYTERAIRKIVKKHNDSLLFFGTAKKIVAIKVTDEKQMRKHCQHVRQLYLDKKIEKCIGWQLYQSFEQLPFEKRQIKGHFVLFEDETIDFNTPKDYKKFLRIH
ncbi:NTP transferase domain-containing protein [Enterococcus olivae]